MRLKLPTKSVSHAHPPPPPCQVCETCPPLPSPCEICETENATCPTYCPPCDPADLCPPCKLSPTFNTPNERCPEIPDLEAETKRKETNHIVNYLTNQVFIVQGNNQSSTLTLFFLHFFNNKKDFFAFFIKLI